MIPSPLHFSCYWNLDGEWNPTAPEGMRIWAENLRKFENGPSEEQYTWYGKLSFNPLGIPAEIEKINQRIQEQSDLGLETRLYLYSFYEFNGMKVPYSLHVANVLELRDQGVYDDPKEQDHIPRYFYESMLRGDKHKKKLMGEQGERWAEGKTIPFFFKINDLRELSISDAQVLQRATEESNFEFQQFRWDDTKSPAYIIETTRFPNWFDEKTMWWREVLKTGDDLDPGKFKTNSVKEVYYQALQYAAINRPILLVGQRGTGKTHLARFIRRNSQYCRGKYSDDWPLISCAEDGDPSNLQERIFGEHGILSGETLVLDDIEHMPHFLVRRILNRYEREARNELSTDPSAKSYRIIGCTSLLPHELHSGLDPRFLDATAAILELPSLASFKPEDRVTVWNHQYEQVRRLLFPNEAIPGMTDDEKSKFLEMLHKHPLPGNFRDLQRIATRILLDLKFRETISDREKRPDLEAEKIFRESVRYPQARLATGQEKAETLSWWFLNNTSIEDLLKLTDFEGLQDLVNNLTRKVRGYLADQILELAESGSEKALEIYTKKYDTIRRWIRESSPDQQGGDSEDDQVE